MKLTDKLLDAAQHPENWDVSQLLRDAARGVAALEQIARGDRSIANLALAQIAYRQCVQLARDELNVG